MVHITMYTLAVSADKAYAQKFWTHTAQLRRSIPQSELTMLPIEYADDPDNRISVWSNVDAADIVIALLSDELLSTLDEYVDPHTGVNHVLDLIEGKRGKKAYRVLPVRVRSCSWDEDGSSFQGLGAFPHRFDPPITTLSPANQEGAWVNLATMMRQLVKEVQTAQSQAVQPVMPKAAPQTAIVAPSFCPQCESDLYGAKHCRDCGTSVAQYVPAAQPVQQVAAYQPVQPILRPAVASSPSPVANQDAVLLLYHTKDSEIAKRCLLHLQSCGVKVIDGQNRVAGSNIRESFRQQVSACQRAIFLVSADFIAALSNGSAQSVLRMIEAEIPRSLLAKSLVIPIRACWYDGLFTGVSMEAIEPAGWKVDDKFWLSVAQQISSASV